MSLIAIIITLAIIGVILWLVNTFIPMPGSIKKIINIVTIIAIILWLLNVFGVLHGHRDIHVESEPPISMVST